MKLQLGKWGRSIAVRIPKHLVERYRLKDGDEIDVAVLERALEAMDDARRQEAVERIRKMRWPVPEGYKFDREEANAR